MCKTLWTYTVVSKTVPIMLYLISIWSVLTGLYLHWVFADLNFNCTEWGLTGLYLIWVCADWSLPVLSVWWLVSTCTECVLLLNGLSLYWVCADWSLPVLSLGCLVSTCTECGLHGLYLYWVWAAWSLPVLSVGCLVSTCTEWAQSRSRDSKPIHLTLSMPKSELTFPNLKSRGAFKILNSSSNTYLGFPQGLCVTRLYYEL